MAFKERKITQEDEEWLSQFIIVMAKESGYGNYLTEDKERNACMVQTFGQGIMNLEGKYISEIPIISTLIWNKCIIEIESYKATDLVNDEDLTGPEVVLYSISSIKAKFGAGLSLEELHSNRDVIKEMIREAFFSWQGTAGKILDQNGQRLKDEKGHFIRGRRPFAEIWHYLFCQIRIIILYRISK